MDLLLSGGTGLMPLPSEKFNETLTVKDKVSLKATKHNQICIIRLFCAIMLTLIASCVLA